MQALDWTLAASAFALGLAATPHCLAMCAAPCAAVGGAGAGRSALAFQIGRAAAYAALGALAAGGAGALAALAQAAPALRPAWTAVQLAVVLWGAWMLWRGEQPRWAWLAQRQGPALSLAGAGAVAGGTQPVRGPAPLAAGAPGRTAGRPMAGTPRSRAGRSGWAGLAWVAWPCGMLHSAALLAALTTSPLGGAVAMGGFALASAPALVAAPWLLERLRRRVPAFERHAARVTGAMLVAAGGWSLGHGLWMRVLDACLN